MEALWKIIIRILFEPKLHAEIEISSDDPPENNGGW